MARHPDKGGTPHKRHLVTTLVARHPSTVARRHERSMTSLLTARHRPWQLYKRMVAMTNLTLPLMRHEEGRVETGKALLGRSLGYQPTFSPFGTLLYFVLVLPGWYPSRFCSTF